MYWKDGLVVEEQQDLFYSVAPQTSQGVLHALRIDRSFPSRAAILLRWISMIKFACDFEDSELIIKLLFVLAAFYSLLQRSNGYDELFVAEG